MNDEIQIEDHGKRWQMTLHLDGAAVSGTGMTKMRMRLAGTDVKMGGIAGVWTDEAHRKRGHASRVMHAANAFMADRGCDVAILFGIADFYHRYGYGVVFRESALTLRTEALADVRATLQDRACRKDDLEAVRRLAGRYQGGRAGTAVRDGKPQTAHAPGPKGWRMPRMGDGTTRRPGKAIVVGAPGRVEAYAVFDIQAARCTVTEVGATKRDAFPSLAASIAKRAKRGGVETIRFCLPQDDPFVEFLFRFGAQMSVSQHANAGSMGRILRLTPLFERIASARRKSGPAAMLETPVAFVTDIGSVTLAGTGGLAIREGVTRGARVVELWQAHLLQLLMGHRSADDLAIDPAVRMPRAAIAPLRTLFPAGHPYMHWADRF